MSFVNLHVCSRQNEWFSFLNQKVQFGNQILSLTIKKNRFPFFSIKTNKSISISKILVLAQSSEEKLISEGIGLLPKVDFKLHVPAPDETSEVTKSKIRKEYNIQPMTSSIIPKGLPQKVFDFSQLR